MPPVRFGGMVKTMWSSLAELVEKLWPLREKVPEDPDVRKRAAVMAVEAFGIQRVLETPTLLNVAALTLSMSRMVVHRLSSGAVRTVHQTDLHSLPDEPPRLLRGAWIVEARNMEREVLFGNTVTLGGYPLGDAVFLIGLEYPDGAHVTRWVPVWGGGDIEETVQVDYSPLIDNVEGHFEWSRQAARFAVVLGLLLDSEGSPVAVEEDGQGRSRTRQQQGGAGGGPAKGDGWIIRRVYLDERRILHFGRLDRLVGDGTSEGRRKVEGVPVVVTVRGHLKRQPYGPGRSMRKWIYVRSYEARRWVSPRPVVIEVGVKGAGEGERS